MMLLLLFLLPLASSAEEILRFRLDASLWAPDDANVTRDCVTVGGASGAGRPCRIPFVFDGVEYDGCTSVTDPEGKRWCSTKVRVLKWKRFYVVLILLTTQNIGFSVLFLSKRTSDWPSIVGTDRSTVNGTAQPFLI